MFACAAQAARRPESTAETRPPFVPAKPPAPDPAALETNGDSDADLALLELADEV